MSQPVTACTSCERGYYKPATKPYVQQEDERVAVVTSVPVGRCTVCEHEDIQPEVAVRVGGMLAQMLRTCDVAVRRWQQPEQ